jgi:hypothetical protein
VTAREQARKAANLVPVNVNPEDTFRIADAASDVWQPLLTAAHQEIVLLREVLSSFITSVSGDGRTVYLRRHDGFRTYHESSKFEAIKRAVEAQG